MTDLLQNNTPQIEDGPGADAELELDESGKEQEDSYEASESDGVNWLKRAQEAYRNSTSYLDANLRKKWEDSIKHFNSEHAADSKYNNPAYDKRSKIFRPKIRSVIRKNEAAAAAAFFSNMDVVSIEALSQSDPAKQTASEIMKALIQYRLTSHKDGVPWFKVVQGGIQDAQVTNACARVEWLYDEERGEDRPEVELIPIENLRIDAASSWIDPVNSSPYLIHEFPMWVCDVKTRMENPDKMGRTWKEYDDSEIRRAKKTEGDSTRSARQNYGQDPIATVGQTISDYEVVWIQRHIHRYNGKDWHFYTLSDLCLLSDPEPLKDVVFTGERPYVIGTAVLETHKPLANTLPQIAKGLTEESNEIANQRLDNVKFVLNKGYVVRRNGNTDIAALVRNVPGRVVMTDNPETDIQEHNWPDVTASSYEEQNRINQDMDELLGNFSPLNVPNRKGAETVKGMALLEKPSSMLTEYLLRTYVETFIEPILRMLVKLEFHYETNETILALAGQQAGATHQFWESETWRSLAAHDLVIKVNVGMGATDPTQKLNRFVAGVSAGAGIQKAQIPGLDMSEVWKEIFGHLGYQDGRRFFAVDDPEKAKLQQQNKVLMQMIQMANKQLKDKQGANEARVKAAKITAMAGVAKEKIKQGAENKRLFAEIVNDRVTQANEPEEKNVAEQ